MLASSLDDQQHRARICLAGRTCVDLFFLPSNSQILLPSLFPTFMSSAVHEGLWNSKFPQAEEFGFLSYLLLCHCSSSLSKERCSISYQRVLDQVIFPKQEWYALILARRFSCTQNCAIHSSLCSRWCPHCSFWFWTTSSYGIDS